MNAEQLYVLLVEIDACKEAIVWTKGKSLTEAWATCRRGDWMLWLVGNQAGKPGWATRQRVVLAICSCIELALKYVPKEEDRPRQAIETMRRWARGEATLVEVRKATNAVAADAAEATYYAANAVANAVAAAAAEATYYAVAAANAVDAIYYAVAAADAADAADAVVVVAATYYAVGATYDYDAAHTKVLEECADLVRREIPIPYCGKEVQL